VISTVAGTPGSAGFSGDGSPATTALLSTPEAIAVDAAGNLYIADTGNPADSDGCSTDEWNGADGTGHVHGQWHGDWRRGRECSGCCDADDERTAAGQSQCSCRVGGRCPDGGAELDCCERCGEGSHFSVGELIGKSSANR